MKLCRVCVIMGVVVIMPMVMGMIITVTVLMIMGATIIVMRPVPRQSRFRQWREKVLNASIDTHDGEIGQWVS